MSLTKGKFVQNLLVLFISTLLTLLFCNLLASFWVKNRYQSIKERSTISEDIYMQEEYRAFRKKYQTRLDHLRGPQDLNRNSTPIDQLYTVVNPFLKHSKNLLIQGDSWVNQIIWGDKNGSNPVIFLKNWAQKHNVGLIAAGVGSYAPSPMTVQLEILRNDFNLYPSTLVAIIDQTDIGDELFRYKEQQTDKNGKLIGIHSDSFESPNMDAESSIELNRLIRSNNFALYKIFKYKLIQQKNEKQELPIAGELILDQLKKPLSDDSSDLFRKRLSRYVDTFFSDPKAKTLILITHPHRGHLTNPPLYQTNVSNLVDDVIKSSKWKSKIQHINFADNFTSVYGTQDTQIIFNNNDPFSHLTNDSYLNFFLKYIFERIRVN